MIHTNFFDSTEGTPTRFIHRKWSQCFNRCLNSETRVFIAKDVISNLADCMNAYDRKEPARLIMRCSQ